MGSNRPETNDYSAHSPNQQQQRGIAEERQCSPQSTTTPAWGDRTAEDEANEEKNNDSGLSPDNNSLSSGRTSSATISFSSPGSSTSQDSALTPGTNSFDYNTQSVYSNCKLTMQSETHQENTIHDQEDQSANTQSNTADSNIIYVTHDLMKCPICSYDSTDRKIFIEHISNHYLTRTNMELIEIVLRQLRTLHNEESLTSAGQEGEAKEDEDINIPRLNSQGRIKTFRCKQCNHVAITKTQFWSHSRIHIRLEKLMNCPKCPFVTEYKHHLEYHMRNHVGSKPFKCSDCQYSCVNKSMLNSHMKSHSNVYQYRCANCTYATKYCHSLKLHLRKYHHKPSVVLNADGTPNSSTVYIDVYGTKRGPKKKVSTNKPCTKTNDDSNHSSDMPSCSNNNVDNNNVQPNLHSNLVQPSLVQSSLVQQPGLIQPNLTQSSPNQESSLVRQMVGSSIDDRNSVTNGGWVDSNQNRFDNVDLTNLFNAYNLTNQTHINGEHRNTTPVNGDNQVTEKKLAQNKIPIFNCNKNTHDSDISENENTDEKTLSLIEPQSQSDISTNVWINNNTAPMEEDKPKENFASVPMDLSKPSTSKAATTSHFQQSTINSPKITGTRRRKGIAIKLEHRVMEEDTDEETAQNEEEEVCAPSTSNCQDPQRSSQEGNNQNNVAQRNWFDKDFVCPYCDIAFGNEIMYIVHMGYHCHNDPYTCNKCGEKCANNIAFFLHIDRSRHM